MRHYSLHSLVTVPQAHRLSVTEQRNAKTIRSTIQMSPIVRGQTHKRLVMSKYLTRSPLPEIKRFEINTQWISLKCLVFHEFRELWVYCVIVSQFNTARQIKLTWNRVEYIRSWVRSYGPV